MVICQNCGRRATLSTDGRICLLCGHPVDHPSDNKKGSVPKNNKVSSYTINCHHKYSWSYEYTIDGKKRDIIASSAYELKNKVLERGFPWDDEKVPNEKTVKHIPIPSERVLRSMLGPQH